MNLFYELTRSGSFNAHAELKEGHDEVAAAKCAWHTVVDAKPLGLNEVEVVNDASL